ncbi:MAG: hypothetical protein ACM3YE_02445 [Bacteroidota bacterium]
MSLQAMFREPVESFGFYRYEGWWLSLFRDKGSKIRYEEGKRGSFQDENDTIYQVYLGPVAGDAGDGVCEVDLR